MVRDFSRIIVLASLYVILGKFAFNESVDQSIITPVIFLSEGVALAFTLVFGPTMVAGVFLGQFILALTTDLSWGLSLAIATINSCEALIAWSVAGKLKINPSLRTLRDYVLLVFLIFFVLQPFSALLGNWILSNSDKESVEVFLSSSIKWWIANGLGQLLFAPILMLLFTKTERFSSYRIVDFIPTILLPLLIFLVFQYDLIYLPLAISLMLAILFWSAYNKKLLLLSIECLLTSLIVLHSTGAGLGPIAVFGEQSFVAVNILIIGITLVKQFMCMLFIELKLREDKLKNTVDFENLNRQLRYALDATGDALWDWDLRTNIITHNNQWCQLTGLGEDFLSHPLADFTDLLHEEDRAIVWERLQACLADKGPYLSEHRLCLPGGHTIWVLDRGNVVERDEQGQALRMMGTFLDVTRSHEKALAQREQSFQRAAIELALAKEKAEQASLAKTHLVSHMSHEFRTPLNVILGYAQLLAMDGELSVDQKDYLSEIEKGGNHLRMLINDMLDMAKIEAGHVSLVNKFENIPTIIEECLGLSNALAKLKDISLHYQSTTDINTFCDRTRLIQLLLNMISNAIKYNAIGGRVEITTELSDSNWYIISICDTGRGISADKLGTIFEPFNRLTTDTDTDTEGTGLGLTISRHLVELMGGTLGVNSEIGFGSHFWIKLPLIEDNNEHLPLSTATHFTPLDTDLYLTTKSCQVLYVDDNASNLKLIEKQLNVYPFIEMTTLQSSTKTVAQVLAHRPDVIILDINMPKMNGYQVLAALQADDRLKSIPVIALTANGMLDEQDRGLAAGFSFYLTKPVDKQELMDAINRCRTARK